MRKAFRYRLYPTKSQERMLSEMLEECRWLYNQTLSMRKEACEEEQQHIGWYETKRMIPIYKKTIRPTLSKVHSQVLQNVTERIELAFQAFFRRLKAGEKPGYPRFKGHGRYNSLTYPQSGFCLAGQWLDVSKIGRIWVVLHRPVGGKVKTCTIRRSSTGKWYVCFSCEVEAEPALPAEQKAVGVDVGLEHFATLSTGKHIPNPRFLKKEEKKLKKAQRRLSKEEKGTVRRRKRRKVVAKVHERIAWKRQDFAHKESRKLVKGFGVIAFEDLNIKQMVKNHCLAKSIHDAAWNQLVQYTTYKAESAGRIVVLVDPRNTSKICSRCGTLVDKTLSERVHHCPVWQLKLQRDVNAALNILRLGLQALGLCQEARAVPLCGQRRE